MASWDLITPYGTLRNHKGRSFGEAVWKKPDPDKKFGQRFFTEKGIPLSREAFVFYKDNWIPRRGNDVYAKAMKYDEWADMGKPKKVDGKKVGIVIKKVSETNKVGKEASMVWNATKTKGMDDIVLTRLVTRDMKYIVPESESLSLYRNIVDKLTQSNKMLITDEIQISANSSVWYRYAILPIGRYLVYVEVLDEDLERPFPPDALIPSDDPQDIGDVEEEDVEGLI